jgi:hypothetical protein
MIVLRIVKQYTQASLVLQESPEIDSIRQAILRSLTVCPKGRIQVSVYLRDRRKRSQSLERRRTSRRGATDVLTHVGVTLLAAGSKAIACCQAVGVFLFEENVFFLQRERMFSILGP